MSDLDYVALRKVAEAATPGPWDSDTKTEDGKTLVCHGLSLVVGTHVAADADHIATFDPPTVLRLLDLAQRADVAQAQVAAAGKALDAVTEYANAETARANAAEAAVE